MRGAFVGLKMEHKKVDMLRATVEGVVMNLDIILNIFKNEVGFKSIHALGGLMKSPVITKIIANIYGIEVQKLNYLEEATSLSALQWQQE
jgi:xylulokinase